MPKLSAQKLKNLADGRYGDGRGLYYRKRGGSIQWLFRWQADGKVREISLAGADTSLADARLLAAQARLNVRAGKAPTEEKPAPAAGMTLGKAVEDFIEAARSGWRSETEEKHTRNQLRHHFGHLYSRPVASITKNDILSVLQPVWPQPSVAEKLLSRIERVMRRAAALDLIPTNPADGRIMRALLPRQKEAVEHHAAVPWQEAAPLWESLSVRTGMAALALKLIVLTATRSGEARKAQWAEFDLDAATWTIPGKRTKTGKPLAIPLSSAAVALLASIPRVHPVFVFPGRTGKPIVDMAVLKEMRLLHPEWTVHGWRSSFRDWGSHARHDRDLLEMSLGHAVGSQVERAYARSNLLELRRPIMRAWADHLSTDK